MFMNIHGITHSQKLETIQTTIIGEWINKMWYIHMREYYSAIKILHYGWSEPQKYYAEWQKADAKD